METEEAYRAPQFDALRGRWALHFAEDGRRALRCLETEEAYRASTSIDSIHFAPEPVPVVPIAADIPTLEYYQCTQRMLRGY